MFDYTSCRKGGNIIFNYLKSSFKQRWAIFLIILVTLNIIGFGYIGSLAVSDRITIEARNNLEEKWRYQYDILVLPEAVKEKRVLDEGWVPPQSNLASYGGITLEDVSAIRDIPGVNVAAPLSMIGFYQGDSLNVQAKNAQPGEFYEVHELKKAFDGLNEYILIEDSYVTSYYSPELEESLVYNRYNEEKRVPEGFKVQVPPGTMLRYPNELMVVAVDPDAEEKLFSFSESVEGGLSGLHTPIENLSFMPHIPFIALKDQEYEVTESITVNKIQVPELVSEEELADGAENYLKSLPKQQLGSLTLPTFSPEWKNKKAELFLDGNSYEEQLMQYSTYSTLYKYSPLLYEEISFEENSIPFVRAKRFDAPEFAEFPIEFPSYRHRYEAEEDKQITPKIVGYYDANKIRPVFESAWKQGDPVDIYTPHHSIVIIDGAGIEIEPTALIPIPLKSAYYPGAPDLLTSLDAAKWFYKGNPPVSSIRVMVDGVAERSGESQRKIEQVAAAIMEKTGHHVEIMLGSAGGKVHVQLEGTAQGEVGVVEEAWQQQGVSWSIEKQMDETNKWLFFYLLIISFVFSYTVITHSLLKRAVEFATLRAIGWSRGKIVLGLCAEVLTISSLAIFTIIIVNGLIGILEAFHLFIIWIIFNAVIGIGYISGAGKSLGKSPRAGLSGETNQWGSSRLIPIQGLGTYVLHQVVRRPLRFGLLVGTLAMTLFIGLIFVATQQSMSDFLFLSVLGETIDLNIKSYQRIFLIGGMTLTIMSIFFLLFLNIVERKKEFLIMRSIGWSLRQIQWFLSLEVIVIAFTGSLVGVLGASLVLKLFTSITLPLWTYMLAFGVSICLLLAFTIIISHLIKMKSTVRDQHAA